MIDENNLIYTLSHTHYEEETHIHTHIGNIQAIIPIYPVNSQMRDSLYATLPRRP